MNGSGDTKHNARKHHEDNTDIDHRAKKFLAGLSKKERSAWLQEQGYTMSKDGVLVSSNGSKTQAVKMSSRRNVPEVTSSEDDEEEDDEVNETSSSEDAQSPVFQKIKPKLEQKRPVSSSTSDTTETNESGVSDSDDDNDKTITQEDDTEDESSSDAESAASGDCHDGAGEQSPMQEMVEVDQQEEEHDREGDSPNTLIRKRHTKLMHKISEEGFLTLDDMELCVWRQGGDQYQGGTQPTKSDVDTCLPGENKKQNEPIAPDFGNEDKKTNTGVDLINTCSETDCLQAAGREVEVLNQTADAVNPRVEDTVHTAEPELQTASEAAYPVQFGKACTSYSLPHSAGPKPQVPSQDLQDLASDNRSTPDNCGNNESDFKTKEELVYSIQQSYQKLGDDAIHFVLGKKPSPRSKVNAIPRSLVHATALEDLGMSSSRDETADAQQETKGSESEEKLNHSPTHPALEKTNEDVNDGGLETILPENNIALSENKNCSRSSSSESNFKKLLSQQYGFSSVTSSPLNLSVRKPEFDDHCFDLLPQPGQCEPLTPDPVQIDEKATLQESTVVGRDQSVENNPSKENQGVSSGNGPPNCVDSHEETKQDGVVDTNTNPQKINEGFVNDSQDVSDHVTNDAVVETGKSPCPTFIRYDGIAEFSARPNLENTPGEKHPQHDFNSPKVDKPQVKFKLSSSHDQETCTEMDQKMLSLREHVNKSFVKSILANGHCAKAVLEMKRQERDNYEKYETQNRIRLEREQKKQQAQVTVETTVTECWVTGSKISSSTASSVNKKCDKTIHYPPIKVKKKCAQKFSVNDPNLPTISSHKQDGRNDFHNRNSGYFMGLNQSKLNPSKVKQGLEVTQTAHGKELVVTLPRLGHMSTQIPGDESNDDACQINRPQSPEENVNADLSVDPRKGKLQFQGAHVYQNVSRIPKPAFKKPESVQDDKNDKAKTHNAKVLTREDQLPSINKVRDLRDSKDENRFKPKTNIQKTSLPLLKQKPKDKMTDPVAEPENSDVKMTKGNFLPKINPQKQNESTGNRIIVKNKTSNNSDACWDTKTLTNKEVKAKTIKQDDKLKSRNETKSRQVSLKPIKKDDMKAKHTPPDIKSRDTETPENNPDLDDPVQTLVKKVESEIAEKVLQKLSKLSKTGKVQDIDPDASLSEKVRAKLQLLDETSDEDESMALPPMMTDARIGMFAYKKDTPMLRKTEASAIDEIKTKFETNLAPKYKEKGKLGQDGRIKKQQPSKCYEKTYTDLRAEALARARGSVKTSGNSEKPETVKTGSVDKKVNPMLLPKKTTKTGLLKNSNNNYHNDVIDCMDEHTCWDDSNNTLHYNTDSSHRGYDCWDDTDSFYLDYANNYCLDDDASCLYNSNNNCLDYSFSHNCLDSINKNCSDNSKNNCSDSRNNNCSDNSNNNCSDNSNNNCSDSSNNNCSDNSNNNSSDNSNNNCSDSSNNKCSNNSNNNCSDSSNNNCSDNSNNNCSDNSNNNCSDSNNNNCSDNSNNNCSDSSNNNCSDNSNNNCSDSSNNNCSDNSNNNCLDQHCNTCLNSSINHGIDNTNHICPDDKYHNSLHNANNNSRAASDEDEATPRCQSPGDYSTRCDLERMHCWSSSGLLTLAKDNHLDICVHAVQRTGSKHTKKCRIPVRISSRDAHAHKNTSDEKVKTVMHCRKFPQNILVVLKNNDGVKIGEAKAPIVYTNTAAVNMSDPYFNVEIVEDSPLSEVSDYDPKKLPLADRVKKYQKSRPRNIISGTLHGNKNRRKHSKIKRGVLSRNESQENPSGPPPMQDKEGDGTGNIFQGKRLLNRQRADVKRCVNPAEPNFPNCRQKPKKSKQGKALDNKSSSPPQQPSKLNVCKTAGIQTHQEQTRECQENTNRKIQGKYVTRLASRNSTEPHDHNQDQRNKRLRPFGKFEANGLNLISRCELFSSTSPIDDGGIIHTEKCINVTSTRLNTPSRQGNTTPAVQIGRGNTQQTLGTTDTPRDIYRGANDGRDGTLVDITELQPSLDLNMSLNCESMEPSGVTGQQPLKKHLPDKAEQSSHKDPRQENQAQNTLRPCVQQARHQKTKSEKSTSKLEPCSPEKSHRKSNFGLKKIKSKCYRDSQGSSGTGRQTTCTHHGLQKSAPTQPDTDRNSPETERSRRNIEPTSSGMNRHFTQPSPNTVQFSLYLVQSCPPVDQSLQLYLENERETIETRNSSCQLDPNKSPHDVINSKMIEDLEAVENTHPMQEKGQIADKSKSQISQQISPTNDRKSCHSKKSSRQTNELQVSNSHSGQRCADSHSGQRCAASPSSEKQSSPDKQFLQLINKKVLAKRSEVKETQSRDSPCQLEQDPPGDTESTMIVDHFQEIHTMWRQSVNRSSESRDDSVDNLETSTNNVESRLVHQMVNSESKLSERIEQAAESVDCESKVSEHSGQITKSVDCESRLARSTDQSTKEEACESKLSGRTDVLTNSVDSQSGSARSKNQSKLDCDSKNQSKLGCDSKNQSNLDCDSKNQSKLDCDSKNLTTKGVPCGSKVTKPTDQTVKCVVCESKVSKPTDQTTKTVACKSKVSKLTAKPTKCVVCEDKIVTPIDRSSSNKTINPIESYRVNQRRHNKTDSAEVMAFASSETNEDLCSTNQHSKKSHCSEPKPSSEKYDKDKSISKHQNTKDNVQEERATNTKKTASKGHFKLTPVIAAASPSISKKIPKTKGILFEKMTLTSADSSAASVARSKGSASRCSLYSSKGQGQGNDSRTSQRTGHTQSRCQEGPIRSPGHLQIAQLRHQSPCGDVSGEDRVDKVRTRSGRGARTDCRETNNVSRMTFDKTATPDSREQAEAEEEYCTKEIVPWTRRNPTPAAKGQQRKGRLTLTLPRYGNNRLTQATPVEETQSYEYAYTTEGETSSQEETTDSSDSDMEPARSNPGKTGHFKQPCHEFEKPSLPPLSRRQLGFPHRPKVKRFY